MRRLFRDAAGAGLFPHGSVLTIGAFDGVHRGHRALLEAARADAVARGLPMVALSFEPLPRQHFGKRGSVVRLSTPAQKICLLLESADCVGLLRFNARLASMSAEKFVEEIVVARVGARSVWIGSGFRFGQGRAGDESLLRALGVKNGFEVSTIESCLEGGARISSTRIRSALAAGDFAEALRLLGRPFRISGRVVYGQQLGRTLGYPTANLPIRWGSPAVRGIHAVRVLGVEAGPVPGVASLGTRPTVGGVEPILEAHLFDWSGDLYGRRIEVEFVAHLRDEVRFDGLDALVAQMDIDAARARAFLAENPDISTDPVRTRA